jgi:hypothetical protein
LSWTDKSETKSDIFEDYGGMKSGSHSQTLGRLYAWEKKLYEEVKVGFVLEFSLSSWPLRLLESFYSLFGSIDNRIPLFSGRVATPLSTCPATGYLGQRISCVMSPYINP